MLSSSRRFVSGAALLAALSVSLGMLVPSTAQSAVARAGGWEPAVTIATAETPPASGDVAVDAAGWSVAVWYDAADRGIWSAVKPPEQPWGAAERIGSGSAHRRLGLPHPQVGIDRAGTATVLWPGPGAEQRVFAARHPRGGSWSEPVAVSTPVPTEPRECRLEPQSLRLAVGVGGSAVAAWELKRCRPTVLQAAYASPQGAWIFPATVDSHALGAQLGVDRSGNAVIAYRKRGVAPQGSGLLTAFVSRRPVAGEWRDPRRLANVGDGGHVGPQVAVNPRGVAVVVFAQRRVMAVRRPVAGPWGALEPVSRQQGDDGPVVALDNSGTATVAWRSELEWGGTYRILAARNAAGGSWTHPVEIDPFDSLESFVVLAIATNGPGDIILGWVRWTASAGTSVRAAFRPANGRWRSPKLLARRNWTTPAVGIGRNGDAVTLWTTPEAVRARVRSNTTAP
jgi:hypothetical protein